MKWRKIAKNQEISIRRGDNITLADIASLEWSRIPQIIFPSNIDRVINIGRAPENAYVTKSESTGRNHACLIITRNNKIFILDQSKNGTKVNGDRLPVYQFRQVNKGQKIILGNDEILDWTKIGVPGLTGKQKLMLAGIGVITLLSLLMWLNWDKIIIPPPPEPVKTAQDFSKSIVMVYNQFFLYFKGCQRKYIFPRAK
ncbi:MAG: FHA domain-containing protein [Saprospiraceae bacterium]|nr:FHA domain-containing protein [Saprospiraceae bacterium]